MALITVSGEPGCRTDEVARMTAQRLGWELITESRLHLLLEDEFGTLDEVPDKAYRHLVLSILARLATEHHLVSSAEGSELLAPRQFPGLLRVRLVAPESWRVGSIMLERRLDRETARKLLGEMEKSERAQRKRRFGRATLKPDESDVLLNASTMDADCMAAAIESVVAGIGLVDVGLLVPAAEAQIQFRVRLELAKHKMAPPDRVMLKRAAFVHPSEEIFANLLDFYRIAWEYEPRSFPIQWDKDNRVLEAFTPDFYLPEFDMYVELTTMKQAHVTRKNRKVKLLRTIYPDINIQVFYQKDFENLIFKYGLAEKAPARPAEAVKA
jgi:cytidylate kinase